jgi:hypothetical protein
MLCGMGDHLSGGHAGADSELPLGCIQHDVLHVRQVGNETITGAPSQRAVPSGANSELQPLLAGEVYTAGNIIVGFASHEHGWVLIRRRVPPGHPPGLVVLGIGRKDDASAEARTKLPEGVGIRRPSRPSKLPAGAC